MALRVRIKTRPRTSEQNTTRLDRFLAIYFQSMFFELNSVFSDYHSIQEHASRNKIIEFVSKKLKDLDLLKVFISGASMLRNILYLKFKGEDCTLYRQRILEMADFIGMLYENMKTSFIPRSNINLAIRTQLDARSLLPLDTYRALNTQSYQNSFIPTGGIIMDEADLASIHRLMRIHLIKEKITNYRIENGILFIDSKFFTFELALCGHYQTPKWLLFGVKTYTGTRKVEDQLMRRLVSIDLIVNFVKFFENRKNALEIFNLFENKSGFYQNFTCTTSDVECRGQFKGNDFYFRVSEGAQMKEFKNADVEEVKRYVFERKKIGISSLLDEPLIEEESIEFQPKIFGPNRVYFEGGMFFSLSKRQNVFFFGRLQPVCGIVFHKLYLKVRSGQEQIRLDQTRQEQYREDIYATSTELVDGEQLIQYDTFVKFIKNNINFLKIAFILRDIQADYEITEGIFSKSFYVDFSLSLYYVDRNKVNIPINLTESETRSNNIANRIRHIIIQETLPSSMRVVASEPGVRTVLQFDQIRIEIETSITTSIKELTEDIRQFNMNEAIEYIRCFAVFYTNYLFPTFCTPCKICIDLFNFIDETLEITAVDGRYSITGPKTLKVSKAPKIFGMKDMKVFHVLQKIFLTDRFIFLKKNFEVSGAESTANEIHLSRNRKMHLTQEGIKFVSGDEVIDKRVTQALNYERDLDVFFENIK